MRKTAKLTLALVTTTLLGSCASLAAGAKALAPQAPDAKAVAAVNLCPAWVQRPPGLEQDELLYSERGECLERVVAPPPGMQLAASETLVLRTGTCRKTLARPWIDYANTVNDDMDAQCGGR